MQKMNNLIRPAGIKKYFWQKSTEICFMWKKYCSFGTPPPPQFPSLKMLVPHLSW